MLSGDVQRYLRSAFLVIIITSIFSFSPLAEAFQSTISKRTSIYRTMSSTSSNGSDTAQEEEKNDCLWESANAITLRTSDMKSSTIFYEKLGLSISFGGYNSPFTTMSPSSDSSIKHNIHVNLEYDVNWPCNSDNIANWGRIIFHVSNVDDMYNLARDGNILCEFEPIDAAWGERYFHIIDPAGHELSFAKRIDGHVRWEKKEEKA